MSRKIHAGLMCQNNLMELVENVKLVLPYVDSMTIIDGGSVDDTIIYMRNWSLMEPKIKFFVYPWQDDFPGQRNNYVKHIGEIATEGDWMLTLDPDEFFEVSALEKLHRAADRAEKDGRNMIGFQCRSVSLKGSERVWENLDEYWKHLYIKWDPKFHYTGYKCHEGKGGIPHNIMNTSLVYEHIKQENVIWVRGFRNLWTGGGGPNLGSKNPIWVNLRQKALTVLSIERWHDFYSYMLKGNIDTVFKDIFINHMYEGTRKGGDSVRSTEHWDGASEVREMYKTYFRILHPEEEPKKFQGINLDDWG